MRARFWVVAGSLLVISLLLILFTWNRSPDLSKQAGPEVSTTNAVNASSSEIKVAQKNAGNNLRVSNSPVTVSGNASNKPEAFQQMVDEKNGDVHFFGKVIDQDSNALAGVNITVKVRQWYVQSLAALNPEGRMIPLKTVTGPDGRFEITGLKGDAIELESMQKEGYELEPIKRTFGIAIGTSNVPLLFRMWSSASHQELVAGKKSFHMETDGRPYFFDFSSGTFGESGNGDLKVWINLSNPETDDLRNWSCGISATAGEVLEEEDGNSAMYLAPAEGYTSHFELRQQIKGSQSGSIGTRRFYLKMKDGQIYGRFKIELVAPYNNSVPGLMRIEYAINPSGSRFLH